MTLAATATVDWSAASRRVRLDIVSTPGVTDLLTVYRVHEDGSRYKVLTDQPPVMVTSWSGFDYHAPFNQPFAYVAETPTQVSPVTPDVYLTSDESWMISASDPTLSVPVSAVMDVGALSWDDPAQRFQPLNAPRPVHYWSRPRSGPFYSLSVLTNSPEEDAQMLALTKPGGPVLLNLRRADPVGWMWVQLSKPTLQPVGGNWRTSSRTWVFSVEETTQPDVDVISEWDFDGLAVAYPDFDTATAAYADFGAMSVDA